MEENRELNDPAALLIKAEGVGNGSGFFVKENLIATNIHVVAAATSVSAELVETKTEFTVEGVAAFDTKNDLVILKITGEGTSLPLGDSNSVESGDVVQVVGYPGGKYKVTEGPIRSIRNSDKWIRMSLMTVAGNSGGPVLNSSAEVIGVAIASHDCYSFSIPINAVKKLLIQPHEIKPLAQWQERKKVRAYACLVRSQTKHLTAEKKRLVPLYDKAIVDLDKAIQLNPDCAFFYYNRGVMKFQLGRLKIDESDLTEVQQHYRDAIVDHTKAIKLCPDFASAYDNRGTVKSNLGRSKVNMGNAAEAQHLYQDAIDDYTEAIKLCPDFASAHSNRGATKSNLGQSKVEEGDVTKAQHLYQDAIADHTEAIKLYSDFASAYNNRADVKFHFGKSKNAAGNVKAAQNLYQEALIDINTAIELDSDVALFYHTRGEIRHVLGDYSAAIEDYEKAREIDPDYTDVCKDLKLSKKALEQQNIL